MKKYLINKYYYFLMFLEDVIDGISIKINRHRNVIDDKYFDLLK